MRYRRLAVLALLASIGALPAVPASAQSLVAAVLPTSRSVQVGSPATAFATIINTGDDAALSVGISLQTNIPASFRYQTTDPQTNTLTGSPNTPVAIPAHGSQSFLIAITPTAPIPPMEVAFNFAGTNTSPVVTIIGVNTLLLSASTIPTPDVIALASTIPATVADAGILNIFTVVGTGPVALASANVGAGGSITVSADTGNATLPVGLSLCETNPQTGACTSAIGPTVVTQINAGATPTFSVFVAGNEFIPFDPANSRIFVRFKDGQGITRGSTSVAVRTFLVGPYTQGSGTLTLSNCRFPSNNGTSQVTFGTAVLGQVGDTISGTFGFGGSGGTQAQAPFSATITPSGNILSTTVEFSVSVLGIPVGTGTATLTGQITGETATVNFSGQLQDLESCNVTGSGTAATRLFFR